MSNKNHENLGRNGKGKSLIKKSLISVVLVVGSITAIGAAFLLLRSDGLSGHTFSGANSSSKTEYGLFGKTTEVEVKEPVYIKFKPDNKFEYSWNGIVYLGNYEAKESVNNGVKSKYIQLKGEKFSGETAFAILDESKKLVLCENIALCPTAIEQVKQGNLILVKDGTTPLIVKTIDPLSENNKAKESEAKTYVNTMNNALQAFYTGKDKLAGSLSELNLGINSETENYVYSVSLIDRIRVQSIAIAKSDNLKSYTGGVFLTKPKEIDMSTEDRPLSLSVLCESNQPTNPDFSPRCSKMAYKPAR